MQLLTAGFAYPEVDGAYRADLGARLLGRTPPAEVFVLSTCLRMEVATIGDREHINRVVADLFGDSSLSTPTAVRTGEDAVEHLFRIAAGLESPILGEREILTQFRRAVHTARDDGRITDGLLLKVLDTAVSVGRQARQLLPEFPHDSMASVAAQVVGGADRVAVFGSGLMAKAAATALLELPAPPQVTMVARNPDSVSIEGVTTWGFDRALDALDRFPAVISATSAKHHLVTDELFAEVLASRSAPLILVDMAMPPDFSPPSGSPVRYVSIDDLARMAGRRARSHDADTMVAAAAADTYRHLSNHVAVGPVIGGLMRTADDIVDQVVDRFVGRLGHGDDVALLKQTAHTVARTLVARPVAYIRSADRPEESLDVLARAFGVGEHPDGG